LKRTTFTIIIASLIAVGGIGMVSAAYLHHIDSVKLVEMEQIKEKKQEEAKQDQAKKEQAKIEQVKIELAKIEQAKIEEAKKEEAKQAQKIDDFRNFLSKNTSSLETEINNLPNDINKAREEGTIGPAEIVVNDIKRIKVLMTEAESFADVPEKYKTYFNRYLATFDEDKKTLSDIQADFVNMPFSYISSKQQHLTDSLDTLKQIIHQTK
jgi:flagellar motor protein MotB